MKTEVGSIAKAGFSLGWRPKCGKGEGRFTFSRRRQCDTFPRSRRIQGVDLWSGCAHRRSRFAWYPAGARSTKRYKQIEAPLCNDRNRLV